MKKIYKAFVVAMIAAVAGTIVFIGCKKEKEKALSDIQVSNISFTECLSHTDMQQKGWKNPDSISVRYNNGILYVTHYNLTVNCGWQDIKIECKHSNDSIFIKEEEICPAQTNCMCKTNNSFQLNNISTGKHTLIIESCNPIYCQTFNF